MAAKRKYALGGKAPGEAQDGVEAQGATDPHADAAKAITGSPAPSAEPPEEGGVLHALKQTGRFIRGADRYTSEVFGNAAEGLKHSLTSAITAPRDAIKGTLDPRSDEGIDRIADMGLTIGGSALALPGERGALGMFAGRKSATAPHAAMNEVELAQANHAFSTGETRLPDDVARQFWKDKGVDMERSSNTPMYEIDDSKSVYKGQPAPPNRPSIKDFDSPKAYQDAFLAWDHLRKGMTSGATTTMKDVLDHPEAYKAYPELADVPIHYNPQLAAHERGSFDRGSGVIELNPALTPEQQHSILLHEASHWVQHKEGWQGGASLQSGEHLANQSRQLMNSAEGIKEIYDHLQAGKSPAWVRKQIQDGNLTGGEKELKHAQNILSSGSDANAVMDGVYKGALERSQYYRDPFSNYQRFDGEIGARNTQARHGLDTEQRRKSYWKDTEDYQGQDRITGGDLGQTTPQSVGPLETYRQSIPGKPDTVNIPGQGRIAADPIKAVTDSAEGYMKRRGLPGEKLPESYPAFDEDKARRIAQAFDAMKHDPTNPAVKRSYEALVDETMDQYRALKDTGIDFQFHKQPGHDPYAASPSLGYLDLTRNGRLSVFPTQFGYGTLDPMAGVNNPLLKRVGPVGDLKDATANDAFRVVHDMYGHFGPGNPFFRAPGEERAWINHQRMYSPEARGAMTSETRGQNSWVNYGPKASENAGASGADTVYADQKAGLMPDWAMRIEGKATGGLVQPLAQGGFIEGHNDNDGPRATARDLMGQPNRKGFNTWDQIKGPTTVKIPDLPMMGQRIRPANNFAQGGPVSINQPARERLLQHLASGGKVKKPPKPPPEFATPNPALNVVARKVLEARRQQMMLEPEERMQSTGEKLFDDTPEAYERTTALVPQREREMPRAIKDELPLGDRLRPLIEQRQEIAQDIASRIAPHRDSPLKHFYATGPVQEHDMDQGESPEGALSTMRRMSNYIGATSPRTDTETNLRNATLLHMYDQQGLPYQGGVKGGNLKGYNMMGMHTSLAGQFRDGTLDDGANTKPAMFQENVGGNLQPVTADTHNIRAKLFAFDRMNPGKIPPGWFKTPADYQTYLRTGTLDPGAINDTMQTASVRPGQRPVQVEYRHIADMTKQAGALAGIAHPAQAQSLEWFANGSDTNLKSKPKTLVDLLNERINVTAQALGMPPAKVWQMVRNGDIPLMARGGQVRA